MGLLFLLVFFQVIARVILRIPTSWSVELGRVLFLAVVFIGSAVLVFLKGHMVITAMVEKLPPVGQRIVGILDDVLIGLTLMLFCIGSLDKTITNWKIQIPTLEWVTNGYMYLIVFIGGMGMLLFTINDLVNKFRRSE